MLTSERVVIIYLVYLLVLAWTRVGLSADRRLRITLGSASILALIGALARLGNRSDVVVLHDWLPLAYILAGYWLSGMLYVAPMPSIEAKLAHFDRRLFAWFKVEQRIERAPQALLEYLEAAYCSAPILLGAGLVALWGSGRADLVDRYWTTVILAEFGAFGVLPWVQTRPPWALEPPSAMDRRALGMRRVNHQLVRPFMIRANTFPSGHAAGTLAVAIAVMAGAPAAGAIFLVVALSVSFAAVVGRYHYAADVAVGLALALVASWVGGGSGR